MKTKHFIQKILIVILTFALFPSALAQTPQEPKIDSLKKETQYGSVAYPALSGYPDEVIQVNVNLLLLERGNVLKNIDTLMKQDGNGWGMDENFRATLNGDVLSVVFSIMGDLNNHATEQAYQTLNYDLINNKEITVKDIFNDVDAAREQMEQMMLDTVSPLLSGYIINEEVTPLPLEKFYLTSDSITFYYETEQWMMLSGYAGSASFYFYELSPYLNLDEGSILSRLGVGQGLTVQPEARDNIAAAVAQGTLPSFEFMLNDMLQNIFDTYHILSGPDYFPNARYYQLEEGEMRGSMLLSDTLKRNDSETPLIGIRYDRINLYGIKVNETTQDEWREILGTPDNSVSLDAYTANDFLLPAGTSDYYIYGDNRLRLHADEDGILRSLFIID